MGCPDSAHPSTGDDFGLRVVSIPGLSVPQFGPAEDITSDDLGESIHPRTGSFAATGDVPVSKALP